MIASLLFTACSTDVSRTNPALPPGFQETQVPTGEISAYLYISQDSTVTIPTDRFVTTEELEESIRQIFVVPQILEMSELSLWTSSSLDSSARSVTFLDDKTAEMVQTLISDRRNMPGTASWRDGMTVNLVSGSGDWADDMKIALKANQRSPFNEAYPVIWDLLHIMPESPPGKPVAVGFVHVNDPLITSLASNVGLNLAGIGQAFGAANVSDIAFVAYAESSLTLPVTVGPDYFKEAGLGAVFVARSTYPGFILSFFLGSFADRAGLDQGPTVKGQQVLVKEIEGSHLMVATVGSTFFVALAPTLEMAEVLITRALVPHVKG